MTSSVRKSWLLRSESPLVGTGMEGKVARDSKAVIVAESNGKVASVTAESAGRGALTSVADGPVPSLSPALDT